MIVAIDVGNTAVKLARRESTNDRLQLRSFDLAGMDWDEAVADGLHEWLTLPTDVPRGIPHVRLASVNQVAGKRLMQSLRRRFRDAIQCRVITYQDLPISVATDAPEKTGIDRLLGAWAATLRFTTPLIVIDAGTTVTVDWVDGTGTFCGGAILPGLEMQTRALASGTDALPKLDWRAGLFPAQAPIPGRNTLAAIQLGVLSSVVGGIERLIRLYDPTPTIILTGGDAETIASHLNNDIHPIRIENLVCDALHRLRLK